MSKSSLKIVATAVVMVIPRNTIIPKRRSHWHYQVNAAMLNIQGVQPYVKKSIS